MTSQLHAALRRIAAVILEYLPKVSEAAVRELSSLRQRGYTGDAQTAAPISRKREQRAIGLQRIIRTPFNAYVKARHESGGKEIIYLFTTSANALGAQPDGFSDNIMLCSYKTDLGIIAELDVNDSVELPNGEEMLSIEKNVFTPRLDNAGWDGVNNHFQISGGEEFISSLRELKAVPELSADAVADAEPDIIAHIKAAEEQLAANREKANRRRRAVITSGALRDQPILDSSQGGIFRMPINSVVAVTGAPGTGKTTLLIKRLAQKTNMDYLTEGEKALINADNPEHQKLFHPQNWTLFVPSEGLRDYLKEAMAHEMIPANAETVKVWDIKSKEIARDVFGYIGHGKTFAYRKDKTILSAPSGKEITACACAFDEWHEAEIISALQKAKEQAANAGYDTALLSRLQQVQSGDAFGILRQAELLRDDFGKRGEQRRRLAEVLTNSALTTTPGIIDKVAAIFPASEADNVAEDDDDEESDSATTANTGREDAAIRAKRIITQTIMRHARGDMGKGAAGERARKLWALIEPAMAQHRGVMPELKELAIEQKIFAPLAGGFRNYLNGIPRYYQRFRRHKLRQEGAAFFHPSIDAKQTIDNREISADEVDIINFVMLKNAAKLAEARQAQNNNIIRSIAAMQKTQIAADEATDFSAVQLGCMYYLAHPRFRSLTMVGDLMQRMTTRGIRSFDECKMFAPNLAVHAVKKTYRQSRRLTMLAMKLYRAFMNEEPPFDAAHKETDKGPPLLQHITAKDEDAAEWIACRVLEIYHIHNGKLPAIAVFVPDEPRGQKITSALTAALEEKDAAMDVKFCPEGAMTAVKECVHVIPVQFVKGLEFEGVFFVGLDDIARAQKEAERYLYVGVTRAAQFLAVICRNEFPARLSCVRADFAENGNWQP